MLLSLEKTVMTPPKIITLLHMIHSKESLNSSNMRTQLNELKEMNVDVFFNVEQFASFIR